MCETWSLVLREEHRLRVSNSGTLNAEEDIWAYEGSVRRRLGEIAQ